MDEYDGAAGWAIDLNADLGESYGRWTLGDDEAMLDVVTSANIACGFHAGDPATLLATVRAAGERGVAIGAQVGYPDLAGFGRRFMDIAPADLTAAVLYQIGALDGLCRAAGTRVRYVKPHGALYHSVARHEGQAAAVVAAVASYDASLTLVCLPGSVAAGLAAEAGLTPIPEAFADRGYRGDGTLVPRDQPDAVLDDPALAAARAVRLARDGSLLAADGVQITVIARSLCVHGDSPGAVGLARAVRQALETAGVALRSFVAASP